MLITRILYFGVLLLLMKLKAHDSHTSSSKARYSWAGYLCVRTLRLSPCQKVPARAVHCLVSDPSAWHNETQGMLLEKSPLSSVRLVTCFSTRLRWLNGPTVTSWGACTIHSASEFSWRQIQKACKTKLTNISILSYIGMNR